jgi:hypothetical protein
MGFLRRLLGQPAPQRMIHATAVTFDNVRDDAMVDVVGEQYYPDAMTDFRRARLLPDGDKAVLMPDPSNKFDPQAVVVLVKSGPESMSPIGHLPSEVAARYRAVFDQLAGKVIQCEVALAPRRGGGGADGVVLHLGTPGELIAEIWTNEHPLRSDHRWAGSTVAFSGTSCTLSGVYLDREGQILLARRAGCVGVARVTKKVSLCVAADPLDQSGNLDKARDYGLAIVAEREFWTEVGVAAEALGKTGRWAQPSGYR